MTALSLASAGADVYELNGGGSVEGTLVKRGEDGSYIVKTSDGVEATLAKGEIARIVQVDEHLAEYRLRSRTTPDTADGQRALARWCKEIGLSAQAELHFERLLQLAPDDEEARLALDYQQADGRWLTRDEIMKQRGMVLYKGTYRTPQDIALRERTAAAEANEAEWVQKLRLWRGWLDSRRPEQSAEAQANFDALNEPAAIPALLRILAAEKDQWAYSELLKVAARFPDPEVTRTLINATLEEAKADLRELALDLLTRDGRRVPLLPYMRALKSKDNRIVNRAGKALAAIGDPEAVSALIDALVTQHEYAWRSWFVNEQAKHLASTRRDL